jgi:hypothetical protein
MEDVYVSGLDEEKVSGKPGHVVADKPDIFLSFGLLLQPATARTSARMERMV